MVVLALMGEAGLDALGVAGAVGVERRRRRLHGARPRRQAHAEYMYSPYRPLLYMYSCIAAGPNCIPGYCTAVFHVHVIDLRTVISLTNCTVRDTLFTHCVMLVAYCGSEYPYVGSVLRL